MKYFVQTVNYSKPLTIFAKKAPSKICYRVLNTPSNTESIFLLIFLPKSGPVAVGTLYRPPEEVSINLWPEDTEIFRGKVEKLVIRKCFI